MRKKESKPSSLKSKLRLFSKRRPSTHAKKWLNTYFKEELFVENTEQKANYQNNIHSLKGSAFLSN